MILRKEIEDIYGKLHRIKAMTEFWTRIYQKRLDMKLSGHAAKLAEELFRVKGGNEEFFMKPMNCPHHMQFLR